MLYVWARLRCSRRAIQVMVEAIAPNSKAASQSCYAYDQFPYQPCSPLRHPSVFAVFVLVLLTFFGFHPVLVRWATTQ